MNSLSLALPFILSRPKKYNGIRIQKTWHIYFMPVVCLNFPKLLRGRNEGLPGAAYTGCVQPRWMDEREASHRLPHLMMPCFP